MPIKTQFLHTVLAASVLMTCGSVQTQAGEPFNLIDFLRGEDAAVKSDACGECGHTHGEDQHCITRYPVEDCVVGKKKVFDSKVKYEWVSVPETRYHWKKKLITKEIPAPYCKPVCETEDSQRCAELETWDKHCDKCGELHCKHTDSVLENAETKHVEHEKGETTIKVKYWSCVKVPYTVYRQVKKPVCVKQPRYEKVEVSVTRYVCRHGNDETDCSDCDKDK